MAHAGDVDAVVESAMTPHPPVRRDARGEDGSSLIEAMGATMLLAIVMAGLLSMDTVASRITENYGHLAARTAEYAQDKMEQLVALAYGDTTSNTAVFPATSTGGTGLNAGGTTAGSTAGSSNTATPVAGYVDYLDQNGQLLVAVGTTPPANWYYKRVWQISVQAANLKQITVSVTVARGYEHADPAISTMSVLKSFPF
jgi:hypothetical protein